MKTYYKTILKKYKLIATSLQAKKRRYLNCNDTGIIMIMLFSNKSRFYITRSNYGNNLFLFFISLSYKLLRLVVTIFCKNIVKNRKYSIIVSFYRTLTTQKVKKG